MRRREFLLITIILIVACNYLSARDVITLQTGWKFAKGNIVKANQVKFDDSKWEEVSIPHDWAISGPTIVDGNGDTGKLPWKGEGWYRLTI